METSVRKDEVFKILDKYKPAYLHITLHASDTEGLYFEGLDGKATAMSADEFANILQLVSAKKRPQVIVLSACNSKTHAEAVKAYCSYSVGTKAVFPEKAGVVYAQRFYETLFNDNYTDIPYCHKAAVLAIEQTVPPFGPQAGFAVHDIPELITA